MVALPPVELTTTRADLELKSKLAQHRMLQVDDVLNECKAGLSELRSQHVSNEQRRQDALIREQDRARRREAKQDRIRARHANATKIQAGVRSFFARKFILPEFREAKEQQELMKSRLALADNMLVLHQNIHDLAFLDEDQHKAAVRIQAWWRGVLATRVVAIITFRNHLNAVGQIMARAATRIQAIVRGRQARSRATHARMEKERRIELARKHATDRKMKAVVKMQAHYRRMMAVRKCQARRARLAKDIDGDGRTTPPNETRERGEAKGKSGERGRRKKNVESHTGSTVRKQASASGVPHSENAAHGTPILAFESTTTCTTPNVETADMRRMSYNKGHGHKTKKLTRKLDTKDTKLYTSSS